MMDQAERLRTMFQSRMEEALAPPPLSARVITITSGKGGVGKTNFAVNLAIYLSKQGKRVVIMDADFGLANIELLFGIIPCYSLADVLMGDRTIDEVICNGPLDVRFISGGSGLKELANISDKQMAYLIRNFMVLDSIADVILIDTGAGISKSVVNFIKASKECIIVTTPEPTSVTDAYSLVKTIREDNPSEMPAFKVVLNRVDDAEEGQEVYDRLNKVTERFLGKTLSYLGAVPYDSCLVKAVKKQQPVSLLFPAAPCVKALDAIGGRLLGTAEERRKSEAGGILSFVKRLSGVFGN